MGNMSYCRNTNTESDLQDVWDHWEEPASVEEEKARDRIARLVAEMHDQFAFDGTYTRLGIEDPYRDE